ncbi:MAG: hypothetical protein AAFY64_10680, partial [Pseudomonadota bacterium]
MLRPVSTLVIIGGFVAIASQFQTTETAEHLRKITEIATQRAQYGLTSPAHAAGSDLRTPDGAKLRSATTVTDAKQRAPTTVAMVVPKPHQVGRRQAPAPRAPRLLPVKSNLTSITPAGADANADLVGKIQT